MIGAGLVVNDWTGIRFTFESFSVVSFRLKHLPAWIRQLQSFLSLKASSTYKTRIKRRWLRICRHPSSKIYSDTIVDKDKSSLRRNLTNNLDTTLSGAESHVCTVDIPPTNCKSNCAHWVYASTNLAPWGLR